MLEYLNACILTLTVSAERNPGARTPVSFQVTQPRSVHRACTTKIPLGSSDRTCGNMCGAGRGGCTAPDRTPYNRCGQQSRQRRQRRRRGDHTKRASPEWPWQEGYLQHPSHPKSFILIGENTPGMCRDVALPNIGSDAFCKRWHMGYTCFGDCPRAA